VLRVCRPGRTLVFCGEESAVVNAFVRQGIDAYGIADRITNRLTAEPLCRRVPVGSPQHLPYRDNAFETAVVLDVLGHMSTEEIRVALCELQRVVRHDLYLDITTHAVPNPLRDILAGRERWEATVLECGFQRHPLSGLVERVKQDGTPDRAVFLFEKRTVSQDHHTGWKALVSPGKQARDVLREWQFTATFLMAGDSVAVESSDHEACTYVLQRNCPGALFTGPDGLPPSVLVAFYPGGSETLSCITDRTAKLLPGGRLICGVDLGPMPEDRRFGNAVLEVIKQRLHLEAVFVRRRPAPPVERGELELKVFEPWADFDTVPEGTEFCLAIASASPLEGTTFQHPFPNLEREHSTSPEFWDIGAFYSHPAIIPALTLISRRIKSPVVLEFLCSQVLGKVPPDSADYGAALCVLIYEQIAGRLGLDTLCDQTDAYLGLTPQNTHVLRWQISISFAVALRNIHQGRFALAAGYLERCVRKDSLSACVHLSTKTTEAYFWLGWLSYTRADAESAERWWMAGLEFGRKLLASDLDQVLINERWPNLFDYGDGLREFIYALENLAKCANGIHVLRRNGRAGEASWFEINNCFRFQQALHLEDLLTVRAELVKRTQWPEKALAANQILTEELTQVRGDLVQRTERLEEALAANQTLTEDLTQVRGDLVQRTERLEEVLAANQTLTEDLTQVRGDLVQRTERLEEVLAANQTLTEDLAQVRGDLVQRTERLEEALAANQTLTEDLTQVRGDLVQRTERLEEALAANQTLTEDLIQVREDLVQRTQRLEEVLAAPAWWSKVKSALRRFGLRRG
jgi:phage regulator Rha-like protein